MIVAIVILAWLLAGTLATLIIICIDDSVPVRANEWFGVGLSCALSPLAVLFIIQPIVGYLQRRLRKRRPRK